MSQGGFTDLRLNGGGGEVQEGFWPSFTDIMTVVVMIFLIAMVVLLVRNMELVNQLRATMEAERIAAELARATGEEKDSLSSALHRAEERQQQMQLEIMRLQDSGAAQRDPDRRTAARHHRADQRTRRPGPAGRAAGPVAPAPRGRRREAPGAAECRTAGYRQQAAAAECRATQHHHARNRVCEQLRTRYAESQDQTDRLQRTVAEQRQSLEEARQLEQDIERRYLVLADDFDSLKVKYDKLVRPARSSAGRHLIEVRYWKGGRQVPDCRGAKAAKAPTSRSIAHQLDKVLQRLAGREGKRPLREGHLPREQRPVVQRGLGIHQPPARQLRLLLQGRGQCEEGRDRSA